MGPQYHGCPFCDRVFEIGPTDARPMKRHIRLEHTEPETDRTRNDRMSSKRTSLGRV
ncbi:hypothetical protein [Halococcus hamelinensis]|uniref:hypothetical protein n=1 Tax=Halococcus hamelinensis TaxID=332168 RepID=UPI000A87FFF2|nr:hypothetical protein [Halococcus hamelinensis]